MRDISVIVSQVKEDAVDDSIHFSVKMNIHAITPASDADGELFNQRFGAEILRQIITQLREE